MGEIYSHLLLCVLAYLHGLVKPIQPIGQTQSCCKYPHMPRDADSLVIGMSYKGNRRKCLRTLAQVFFLQLFNKGIGFAHRYIIKIAYFAYPLWAAYKNQQCISIRSDTELQKCTSIRYRFDTGTSLSNFDPSNTPKTLESKKNCM